MPTQTHPVLYTKNTLSHILEQHTSSHQHLQFINCLLLQLSKDIHQSVNPRKAQLRSMTTQSGIQLRKIVLAVVGDLANYIEKQVSMIGEIGELVGAACRQMSAAIRQVDHVFIAYQQMKTAIRRQAEAMKFQMDRISIQDSQSSKKHYHQTLTTKYHLQSSSSSSSFSPPLPLIPQNRYHKQYQLLISHLRTIQATHDNNMMVMIGKMEKLEQGCLDFQPIFKVFARYLGEEVGFFGNGERQGSGSGNGNCFSVDSNGRVEEKEKGSEGKKYSSFSEQDWKRYFDISQSQGKGLYKEQTIKIGIKKTESIGSNDDQLLIK